MRGKTQRRVLAGAMAILMALSLIPATMLVGMIDVKADTGLTFDATGLSAAADKETIAAGTTFAADGSIKVFGEVTKRTASDGSVSSTEVAKNGTGGYEITLAAPATVSIVFSSTGGSNTSTVGVWDASGAIVANNEGVATVTGAAAGKTTLTYALQAGTYKVVSPDATEFNRGARVYSIDITTAAGEHIAAAEGTAPAAPAPTEAATAAPAPTEAPAVTPAAPLAEGEWGFVRYGSSTNDENNGYTGSYASGSVTVFSEGGKGKIVPNSTDGIAFYYTAVPTSKNFTLRANVHVDSWTLSNGQEGFGLVATDRLGDNGVTSPVWNNQYMALLSKVEYYWNSEKQQVDATGTKYSMKCGLGVLAKTGVTKDNLAKLDANDTATVNNEFVTKTTTLETEAAKQGLGAGTYNIVGNATKAVAGTIAEQTDFVLEIQKNNTGYFVTYYDQAGNVIDRVKNYDPDALSKIDSENVYVGFFASRNARATFSNIQFTTIDPAADAPAEAKPGEKITPTLNVQSAKNANSDKYTISFSTNVGGTATVKLNGAVVADKASVTADVRFDLPVTLANTSSNKIAIEFTPDASKLSDGATLVNSDVIKSEYTVSRNLSFGNRNNVYVAPNGKSSGSGAADNPVDIYTAVKYAVPGQTIVLKEGTYLLENTVRIERGIDGTAEKNIYMIADPNASSRPVFDFQGKCAGMVFGGNYWYFYGFDCTHSQNAQKGIQVSGDNNVLDNINAYHNGNTGIQISRLYGTDLFADWPANNLILNCTSYGNADAGYEDADGFAAKLTIGNGNVFDGCLAYNNADDGWDLFAKVETGSIGSVTIQNCVAYGNGYLEDGTNAGNGNGFKMGGDSLSGYHKLINSYAFANKAKGIDSNSCPDIQVVNSISYNNESYNVAFYTNNAANTDFSATGIISFKDATTKSGLTTGEQHKPVGSQNKDKYISDSNYYWNGTKSANASGAEASASWFKTLEFTGVTRNADGTLNMNGFLELTDAAPAGIGARPAGTPSRTFVLAADTVVASPNTADTAPLALLMILAVVSGLVFVMFNKRRITE